MVKKIFLGLLALIVLLVIIFLLGPRPDFPAYNGKISPLQMSLLELDQYVATKDDTVKLLKPQNKSSIIWADSIRKTTYSLVYIHGWSASPMEGDPVTREVAQRYGMNLYLPLLDGHGKDDKESFVDITPRRLIESAKEAIAIGQLLGDKVILMMCSTGGTLGVYLTAENPELVYALLMYAPNIDIYDPSSDLLTYPWGEQIVESVVGQYNTFQVPPGGEQFWTTTYRSEGLICLQSLVEETMTDEIFAKITQPVFSGYYYKDEENQDKVVSIEAIHHFMKTIKTPDNKKREVSFPEAKTHVVLSGIQCKDLEHVRKETFNYIDEVLQIPVAQ